VWPSKQKSFTANDAGVFVIQAREALWQGDSKKAISLLTPVIGGFVDHGVHLAYRSLAYRMSGRFQEAISDGNAAIKLAPSLLEAQFALAAAHLSQQELEIAVWSFGKLKHNTVYDEEGHFLNVLGVVLFGECVANMKETAGALDLRFALTPATRAAICILDGTSLRALHNLSKETDNTLLCMLIAALASYRNGVWDSAGKQFATGLEHVRTTRDPFNVGPSLEALIADAKRRANCAR
jgi:tetratricopeptide (TPR) repeat protein